MTQRRWRLDDHDEVDKLSREIRILLNLVEPDPEFQPSFVGNRASLFDAVGASEQEMRSVLEAYFGEPFTEDLALPVVQLVLHLKQRYAGWPQDEYWRDNVHG